MKFQARHCFVPGCKTGYKKTIKSNKELGRRNCSVFKAKNETQLHKWHKIIPRKDVIFSETDVVCELHFTEEEINRYYETKMPDGSIHRVERGKLTLKDNALPTVFPNLPGYLTKVIKGRKPPKERLRITQSTEAEGRDEAEVFDLNAIINIIKTIKLPNSNWTTAVVGRNLVFLYVGRNFHTEKTLVVTEDLEIKVIFKRGDVSVDGLKEIKNLDNLIENIKYIDGLQVCDGPYKDERMDTNCLGYVKGDNPRRIGHKMEGFRRCLPCRKSRKLLADKNRRKLNSTQRKKAEDARAALRKSKRRVSRLQNKVGIMKNEMEEIRMQCALKSKEAVESHISSLPPCQQDAVRACFSAANVVNSRGRRYTNSWVYDCLLLRIKSKKAYEHLRTHQILALPCGKTLNRYLGSVKSTYGFQESLFHCLKEKSTEFAPEERRGALLIDEMSLSKSMAFDTHTLGINGLTNLGDHTPLHQKNQRGDHALVMMFQPFRGRWVQALACFLSKGCASGTVLHHLILECIILLEKSGFCTDLVTTDGAQWNRSMWNHFGIDSENVSCEHPFDIRRRLWFTSDFPHLVKNLRIFLVSKPETWTPDGVVKLRHWETVVKLDNPIAFKLKACPKLTMDHIHPKHYQKMNVTRAFQFFSRDVTAGMKLFKKQHPNLADCDTSITFIERINKLLRAMNSRTPLDALAKDSEEWKSITDFISYLEVWEREALSKGFHFLSKNTALGFMVSLRTALELYDFLEANFNFKFLMTARMNQDALERFFGMMREACGSNDHPDSILFMQMFKLLSTYSLIKPPKGSNISGEDMLTSLISVKDTKNLDHRKEKLQSIIDGIMDRGTLSNDIPLIMDANNDHDYFPVNTNKFVVSYFSGYLARRVTRFTSCEACKLSLMSQTTGQEDHDALNNWKNEGHLTYASNSLFCLISLLENVTVQVLTKNPLDVDTVFHIAKSVEDVNLLPLVGCVNHKHTLTETIIRFFIFTRLHFVCKTANKAENIQQEKARMHRKLAKL